MRLLLVNAAAACLVILLAGLAVWQVQRRAWKLELISRIDQRVHAAPTAPPERPQWPEVTAARDEYRRVVVRGIWLARRPVLVRAVTELGGGFWVMSPLVRDDGTTVLVNRGFVPEERRNEAAATQPPAGSRTVTGLLRMSEPRGAFLQTNDPAGDRWFSRDVAAIAGARDLPATAPYFIDADRTGWQGGDPSPGLTIVAFSNNHLVYALTWAALALMTAAASVFFTLHALGHRGLSGRRR